VRRFVAIAGAITLAFLVRNGSASAATDASQITTSREVICRIVDTAADLNRLPASFLTRILWQESGFRTGVTSPAGAAGVAQFMPRTAAERGLVDPYDPRSAIGQAARILAEFTTRFGNLGLAAAAYNAGGVRISKWLRARSGLPTETQLYVLAVTGHRIEEWRGTPDGGPTDIERGSCLGITGKLAGPAARLASARTVPARMAAWQVRLDDFLARAVRLRQQRLETAPLSDSNRAAEALCDRIRAMGARCAVYGR